MIKTLLDLWDDSKSFNTDYNADKATHPSSDSELMWRCETFVHLV